MVYFVGAGPGDPDLITVKGKRKVDEADVIIYAGSLVNPQVMADRKKECQVFNSAYMTLEEVLDVMKKAEEEGKTTVRLHTGDPCLYGAIQEQMDALDALGISYEVCPGVSSFCGAAAALQLEYTLPSISQSVVITRMAGRTPVPERESIRSFAQHQTTMVLFLSAGLLGTAVFRTAGRRVSSGHARSHCIQSHLGGRKESDLHCGFFGRGSGKRGDPKDCPYYCGTYIGKKEL